MQTIRVFSIANDMSSPARRLMCTAHNVAKKTYSSSPVYEQ